MCYINSHDGSFEELWQDIVGVELQAEVGKDLDYEYEEV